MANVRKHIVIKLVITDRRKSKLVLEQNYHTTKRVLDDLIAIEMRKTKIKMDKPVYLGMLILDINKAVMYEYQYDYVKPKYENKAKLCYVDTDSFIFCIKTEDFFKGIAGDVEKKTIVKMMIDHCLQEYMKNQLH